MATFVRVDATPGGYRSHVPGTLICTRCEQFVHAQDVKKHDVWHIDIEQRYG